MISVTHFSNGKGAKDYFSQHLSKGDYFAKDAERLVPTFEGKTAAHLGIEGEAVTKEAFYALVDNQHPVTGEQLTERMRENRRAMTDLTFDAGKSVTLAALRDSRVNGAIDQAVDETMREIESAMCARVRKGGKDEDRVTANAIWAVWSHDTTRPLADGSVDPQQHRHVTALNMTWDAQEQTLKAAQFGNIVRDKGYYQAAYHARLAGKLVALGYGIEREGNSFRLAGIDKALCEKFSRRTSLIEKVAAEKGITDAAKKAQLGKLTRNRKGEELSTAELRAEWIGRMTPEEIASIDAARNGRRGPRATADQALDYAVAHIFERESTASAAKVKGEALRWGVGSVLPNEVEAAFDRRTDLVNVTRNGERMVTTQATLNAEIDMLKFARDGRGRYKPMGEASEYLTDLSAEQGAAALHVLNSRDRIVGIRGGAGTGKTTTVKAVIKGIERGGAGPRVYAFAPSATASRDTLRKEGIADADTLEMLLRNPETQAKTKGQIILVDEAGQISTKDMGRLFKVAQQQDARIILTGDYQQHASVNAGDAFRLLESEAGVRYSRLKTIHRQKVEGYKKAVEAISKGDRQGVQKGFDLLDKAGAVIEASGEERHDMLVKDYLAAVKETKWIGTGKNRHRVNKDALIVAPTHAEGERLTESLREALKAEGKLGTRERTVIARKATNWTEAQKGDARNYEAGMVVQFNQHTSGQRVRKRGERITIGGFSKGECAAVTGQADGRVVLLRQDGTEAYLPKNADRFEVYRTRELKIAKGDRLRITKNDRSLKVNNGDIFTVEGFTKDGDLKLDNGTLLPKTYGHMAMGYVDTSYASQSKTVDRVFIAAGNASVLAVNSAAWYVSTSRGRESAKVYVDDKREMREAIARSNQRLSAVELVKPDWQTGQAERMTRSRWQEMLERNRALRYLKDTAVAVRENWRNRVERKERGIGYA